MGASEAPHIEAGADWTRQEVQLVVADYVQMLSLELAGQPYNKSARRRALLPLLSGRSDASVEFKRRNISAVMLSLGYPHLRGYLPAWNTQKILQEELERQLAQLPELDGLATAAVEVPAVDPDEIVFSKVKRPAPERKGEHKVQDEGPQYFRAVKRDYLEREARNRSLGAAGERFVVRYEKWRLAEEGVGQLSDKVKHVSILEGDGLGYDVLSFDRDGRERFIEVKTTSFGEFTPFYVSATEIKFARSQPKNFVLCRLFDFRASPRFFELFGAVEQHCRLDPSTFRATLQ